MRFGLSSEELEFLKETVARPLERYNAKVYLFGSRATGKWKKFSDVDLVYNVNDHKKVPAHVIFSIAENLETSKFPYKVDLVDYDELAATYKNNIDEQKIDLFT